MPLNIIPRSSALSLNSVDVKLFSLPSRIVLRRPVKTDTRQLMNIFQRLVAHLSLINIAFRNPVSMSTM